MAVYPSNMARIGTKLCQNAFQTIPNVSFFDVQKFFFSDFFGFGNPFFDIFAAFWGISAKTDVTCSFYDIFYFR